MKETLQDAVAARLVLLRADRRGGDALEADGMLMPDRQAAHRHELEAEDLRLVASRHFNLGRDRGHADGYALGRGHGYARGALEERRESSDVGVAVCVSIAARLADLAEALAVQEGAKGGKDKRTRADLREEAVEGLERLEAELAAVAGKMAERAL